MGLFIGASILTLLEILDYIYEARDGGLVGAPPEGRGGWGEGRWEKQGAVRSSRFSWPGCKLGFLARAP